MPHTVRTINTTSLALSNRRLYIPTADRSGVVTSSPITSTHCQTLTSENRRYYSTIASNQRDRNNANDNENATTETAGRDGFQAVLLDTEGTGRTAQDQQEQRLRTRCQRQDSGCSVWQSAQDSDCRGRAYRTGGAVMSLLISIALAVVCGLGCLIGGDHAV